MSKSDISVLDQFTVDEILEAIENRWEPGKWQTTSSAGSGWRHRRLYKVTSIMQQVVPDGGGKWKCSSRYGHPSGKFDSVEDGMAAFEAMSEYDALSDTDDREPDLSWDKHYEVLYWDGEFKCTVRPYYWSTWTYEIYRNIGGQYVHLESTQFRFQTPLSAQMHAESRLYELGSAENDTTNWRQPFDDPIVYGS